MCDGRDDVLHTASAVKNIVTIDTTVTELKGVLMKQMIIATISIAVGAGAALLFFLSLSARRTRRPRMTLRELYEDNMCDGLNSLFD